MAPTRTATGTAAAVLTATVARRYYLDGISKVAIAEELGLSRFKVARLVESARLEGMVRIQVEPRGDVDIQLSSDLQAAYRLKHSVVIQDGHVDVGDGQTMRRALGRVAGGLLREIVEADDVLGLAWARSLMEIPPWLVGMAPCTVVQLTGALSRPDIESSPTDLVRGVAQACGGPTYYFHAPMLLPDAATTLALRTQPEVARAISLFPSVTKAVVGVGLWRPNYSTLVDALPEHEWQQMREQGVLGDLSGVQIDAEGNPVETTLTARTIGIDAAGLRNVPEVIGIAYDALKAPAARAGILGGYLNGLVTHAALARELISLYEGSTA